MDQIKGSFFGAVWGHNLPMVQVLLANNPEVLNVNVSDPAGLNRTGLHIACGQGDMPLVKFFLSHPDIEPNKVDGTGWTPFYTACTYCHEEVVREMLLQIKNLDVNRKTETGSSPLEITARKGSLQLLRTLLLLSKGLEVPAALLDYSETPSVRLLKRFVENPLRTKVEIISEFGLQGNFSPLFNSPPPA
jgi:ankyrin repeat protein